MHQGDCQAFLISGEKFYCDQQAVGFAMVTELLGGRSAASCSCNCSDPILHDKESMLMEDYTA